MSSLIAKDEPRPATVHRAGAAASFLFICDHAGRRVPHALGDLGLPPEAFERHIAWDIGAGALALRLGEAFAACAILQTYSRLVIDCNRDPARADAMPEVSDGTPIPANQGLDAEARRARVEAIHTPYHAAIAAELDVRQGRGKAPALVFVHSFTPRMSGRDRPWHFGVLHEGRSPLSYAMIARLRAEPDWMTGDNEPYVMDEVDYSAPTHAIARGLDYLELEVRQDLIADAAGVARIAALLERVLPLALRDATGATPASPPSSETAA